MALETVGLDSLLYWPALPASIEPDVANDRSEERWNAALRRDAYRYGSKPVDVPDAWMAYRAAMEWHRASHSRAEDFQDPEDPEGTISVEAAAFLCQKGRMAAKRKLAWLGEFIAAKIAANDDEFLTALARIPKLVPNGEPPLAEQDPTTGAWREWGGGDSQERRVMNAIFCLAGRWPIKGPTCRKISEFLTKEGIQICEREIRRIAECYGVPLTKGMVGRPLKKKPKNKGKKGSP